MSERTRAWQCIGCGRLESEQQCLGVCHDVPVEIDSAAEYDAAREETDALRLFLRQIVLSAPREGGWERCYRALQERAKRLLG
jgi:hypothetical protein